METLGLKLKKIRNERKFSQRKLGKTAFISHSFICDIEKGRSSPSLDTLEALSKALDIQPSSLIDENVAESKPIYESKTTNADHKSKK
jgi:transcriptional regulator with XRE-family HTH domain